MNGTSRMRLWVETHRDIIWDLVGIYLGIGLFLKGIFYLTHRDYLLELMDRNVRLAGWAQGGLRRR